MSFFDQTMDLAEEKLPPNNLLAKAVITKNEMLVSEALEKGADVNARGEWQGKIATPLVEAAVQRSLSIVNMLLEAGADPNKTQRNGETALANAAQNGDYMIALELLKAGADPNAKTYVGTAYAAASNIAIMQLLHSCGADPNITDEDDDAPIVGSIVSQNYEAVYFLRIIGTNLNHKNKQGLTPQSIADKFEDLQLQSALNDAFYEKPELAVNIVRIRDELESRIKKFKNNEYSAVCFIDDSILLEGEIISSDQRDLHAQNLELVKKAIDAKRAGNLDGSNRLYMEVFSSSEVFTKDYVWGWIKTLLLAKNFKDAQLVMRYFSAASARKNAFTEERTDTDLSFISSSAKTFDFDGFKAFYEYTNTYPMDKDAIERKIRDFGGSPLWSNYSLDTDEYDNFLRYFGIDDFYCSIDSSIPFEIDGSSFDQELISACKAGDFDKASSLLKRGANPNAESDNGLTPLFFCSEVALVCLLIHYGADINAVDPEGNTVLIRFLTTENVKDNAARSVISLLEAGADVDIPNSVGASARSIVENISDCDVRAAFFQGLSAFEKRKQSYLDKLREQASNLHHWNTEVKEYQSPESIGQAVANCFSACALSDLDYLRSNEALVRENIALETRSQNGNMRNMLMVACENSSIDVVKYLISLGADVNQVDDTGQEALRYAVVAWRDVKEKIDYLIEAGANVNHRSDDGSAVLSDAAYYQNAIAVRALLSQGADVNNRDNNGYTALSWSCGKGIPKPEIVELLLREGANVQDLYDMGCILQYLNYDMSDIPREVYLKPEDLKEKYLYEHTLIPGRLTQSGREKLMSGGGQMLACEL